MLKYSEHIPFELGVKLKEAGYWNPRCTYETNYNDPCYFIPSKKFYGEGVVADWDDIVPAPTYADVFEWFSIEKGIIITLEPFFTFALKGNTAYTWKVSFPNEDDSNMKEITEALLWNSGPLGGSFCLTANAAIEFAITLRDKRLKFVEVDINTL